MSSQRSVPTPLVASDRARLMFGCAVGALLVAGAPAYAGSVSENAHGDVNIDLARVDGDVSVTTDAGNATITIGEVATPYSLGQAMIVRNTGTGNATVTVGTVAGAGADAGSLQGIDMSTTSGTLSLDSGTITMRGGYGISTDTLTGATIIQSDSITTNWPSGIQSRSTSGTISIDSGSIAITGDPLVTAGHAIFATTSGAIEIASASIEGVNVTGIQVTGGAGNVAVNSGTIDLTGDDKTGINVITDGAVDIDSGTINLAGARGVGINVFTVGPVTISSDSIVSDAGSGILVTGGAGDVTVAAGDVAIGAAGNQGVFVQTTTGNIGITAGTVTTAATAINNENSADGVFGYASGDGSVTIAVDKVDVHAPWSNAIGGVGGGDITITSGEASTSGQEVATIYAYSRHGDSRITAGTTTATGAWAGAVEGHAAEGDVFIDSVNSSAVDGSAILADAGGVVTIDSGKATSSGDGTSTIFAQGGTGVVITAADTSSSGDTFVDAGGVEHRADAIYAIATTGTATINVGTATATGDGSDAVHVQAGGAVNVSSDTISSSAGSGIIITGGAGDVAVAAGNVAIGAAGNQGVIVQTTTGNIDITAGTVTTAATEINHDNTADGVFGYASGDGAVTIAVDKVDVHTQWSNAIGGVGGGDITITSGEANTSGREVATIYGYSRHADTRITAGTTTATGALAGAIEGHAVEGDVFIDSVDASATDGSAILADAGGVATIDSGKATSSGDGTSTIFAQGGTGVVITAADTSSSGDTFVDAGGFEHRADAIYAIATTGTATVNVGTATATGAGADAVHVIANGTGGAATVNVTGSVSSAQGYGVFIDPPGGTTVSIAEGASVEGALGALDLTSGTVNNIVNAGRIASSTDAAAITATGKTSLKNAGVISSGGTIAVALDATDDTVTLQTGSAIEGLIAGGGGTDSAVLIGSSDASVATQSLARFDGFDSLTVESGYWRGAEAPSAFNTVDIASGGALELSAGASGLTGVAVSTIGVEGTLVVVTKPDEAATLGGMTLAGAGQFRVDGAGTLTLNADNSTFTGTTQVDGGTLVLDSTLGGDLVTNAGGTFVLADGANFAGNVTNGGTFVYDRSGDYTLAGDFSGSGTLVKNGDGTLAFDGAYDFAGTTTVAGGSLRFTEGFAEGAEIDLAGGGSLDLSGQDNTVAELAGSSTESTIDIDDGSLTVEQGSDSVFAGIISGSGGLMKTGDGNLNLTGTNTYSGPTSVTGGTLSVNGSITSTVGVAGGGKLGGNGTVGEVLAGEGGIVGPGNSIGKLNVAGDINFGDGSVYQVEVNAAGSADQIAATGTASIDDARVEVLAEAGDYAPLTEYTILTADGGVEGEFSGVSTDLAFLTPELGYTADAVTLTLIRNDAPFKSFAKAPNQVSVANALETLGTGSALYMAVLTQNAAGAAQAFGALSGEAQAGVGTYLIDESHDMRSAIGSRSLVSSEGPSIWIQGAGTWSESESREGLAKLDNGRTGMIGGVDFGKDTFRFGAVGGYFNGNIDARSLGSHADVKTELMGLFASWHNGRLTAQLGGTYAWHDVDTQRSIAFPGFAGAVDGKTNAHSEQVFGEASYSLNDGPIAIAPVVGFAHVSTHTDGFAETGTVGALRFSTNERNVTFASFGIRASGDTAISDAARFLPRVSARYVHGWGDLAGDARAMFAEGGSSFDIVGAAVGEDTGVLDAGFDVVINDRFSIGASGRTTFSQDWSSQSARVSVGLRF